MEVGRKGHIHRGAEDDDDGDDNDERIKVWEYQGRKGKRFFFSTGLPSDLVFQRERNKCIQE